MSNNKLQKHCKQIVKQGFDHRSNIIAYFKTLRHAAEQEFTEDNKPTLDSFLRECFEESLKD